LPNDYPHATGVSFIEAYETNRLEGIWKRYLYEIIKVKDALKDVKSPESIEPVTYVWPGLAWACTHEAWNQVGGLMDFAVWGGADHHMSQALIGDPYGVMMRDDLHPNYKHLINNWMGNCKSNIRRNIGSVNGMVMHMWHGRKVKRGYNIKHELMAQSGFDPTKHLKRDASMLWQLNDDGTDTYIKIRDILRHVALERDEDSTDVFAPRPAQGH